MQEPQTVASSGGDEVCKLDAGKHEVEGKHEADAQDVDKHMAENNQQHKDEEEGSQLQHREQEDKDHEGQPLAQVTGGPDKEAAQAKATQEPAQAEEDVEHRQKPEQINGHAAVPQQQQQQEDEEGDDAQDRAQQQGHAQDEQRAQAQEQRQDKQQTQEEDHQFQQFSFQNGTLSCAYADLEYIPSMLGQRYGRITKRLDLTGNDLTSLCNLEEFTGLKELIADGNDLSDDFSLPTLSALETLSLNKNKLTDIERLIEEIKDKTPNIRYLSLLWNVACPNELIQKEEEDYRRYRRLVLFHLPKLKFLDSSPVTKKELEEARQVGDFLHVLRLDEDELEKQNTASTESSTFSPLPHKERRADDHRGSIGKCRYVYYGRHSEGNRFIRDRDL